MLNKNIPNRSLIMQKTDTRTYPKYSLPEGYTFAFYRPGDEKEWVRLEMELGQFESAESGMRCFKSNFIDDQRLSPEERIVFVKNAEGEIVATGTLWDGEYLGEVKQRIHWIAVSDRCAGLGIAKAILTKLMDLYCDLGFSDFIYLWTGTRSYPAVALYRKFGFTDYHGDVNPVTNEREEGYYDYNEETIAMINSLIEARGK